MSVRMILRKNEKTYILADYDPSISKDKVSLEDLGIYEINDDVYFCSRDKNPQDVYFLIGIKSLNGINASLDYRLINDTFINPVHKRLIKDKLINHDKKIHNKYYIVSSEKTIQITETLSTITTTTFCAFGPEEEIMYYILNQPNGKIDIKKQIHTCMHAIFKHLTNIFKHYAIFELTTKTIETYEVNTYDSSH